MNNAICLTYFMYLNVNDNMYNDELISKLDYNSKCDSILLVACYELQNECYALFAMDWVGLFISFHFIMDQVTFRL